ncbi:MAG: hypothetical protein QOH56_2524 [Pseudonocardiales bacterium]|jgi:HAD superfamily hydrolase (TIGR01509 family)|nr:hypothetical protein [Pseudonocardiales bacterium]
MALPTAQSPVGVLFDVDGTLVDTTYIHTVCWWQALRKAGLDVPMFQIHRAIGMGGGRLLAHLLDDDSNVDTELISADHDALYSQYWGQLRPLPGARDLIRACRELGLTTVLASSAKQPEIDVLLEVLDVGDCLEHVITSDDAKRSKPEPDIVEVALAKAALKPAEALFVGDAVWDVSAAANAGVACIALESGGTSAAVLRDAGAIDTYRDPADLLRRLADSPLSRGQQQPREAQHELRQR